MAKIEDKFKVKRDIIVELVETHTKIDYVRNKTDQKKVFYIDRTKNADNFNYTFIDFELIIRIDKEDLFNQLFDKEFNSKAKLLGFAVTNKEYISEQDEGNITLHTFIK